MHPNNLLDFMKLYPELIVEEDGEGSLPVFDVEAIDQTGSVVFGSFCIRFGEAYEFEGNGILAIFNVFVDIDDKGIRVIGSTVFLL